MSGGAPGPEPGPTDQDIDRAMKGNICPLRNLPADPGRPSIRRRPTATDGASGGSDTENGEGGMSTVGVRSPDGGEEARSHGITRRSFLRVGRWRG